MALMKFGQKIQYLITHVEFAKDLVHLVFLLHLFHLAELLRRQHTLDPLHVPHEEALRLEELIVGSLPCVLQLVVLLPLQFQLVTH